MMAGLHSNKYIYNFNTSTLFYIITAKAFVLNPAAATVDAG